MNADQFVKNSEAGQWLCGRCRKALESRKVTVSYLGSEFPVDLPVCPDCGLALAEEQLALGKMLEVEKLLEDK